MRRSIVLFLMVVMAASATASQARTVKTQKLVFSGAVPCAVVACTYWHPNPDAPETAAELDNTPRGCTDPIDGTFVDKVLKAPTGATYLKVSYQPDVDWDLFICAKPRTGSAGRFIAYEAYDAESCADGTPIGIVNCKSWVTAKVRAGTSYVIRAYNFADPSDLRATARFSG